VLDRPFKFAGETVPLHRADVRLRILYQVNVLLLDARSVVTLWLTENMRNAWIFDEIFDTEGIPREFVLLAPMLSRMVRAGAKAPKGGIWSLEKPCTAQDGIEMTVDKSLDDRNDLELSTRCFAARIKAARNELGGGSWLMAAAAYMTSTQTIQDAKRQWASDSFWDIPLPENADTLVARWIAFSIVKSNASLYGLHFKTPAPAVFDQVTGVTLSKDLPVSEIARVTGVPPREILALNPKINPSSASFPAKIDGKTKLHNIAAPKGKGQILLDDLNKNGYLATAKKP